MNVFNMRMYYRLEMTLIAPLSIGSGENESTDHDIIVDSNGKPFIPATAIAGVIRHSMSEDAGDNIFGYIPTSKTEERQEKTDQIIIYDARMSGDCNQFFVATRDSVRLENKVSADGAKFDMQAVEPGVKFISYIELLNCSDENKKLIEEAFSKINTGILCFGAKTTRGYGRVELKVKKKEISKFDDYVDFAIYDETQWKKVKDEVALNDFAGLSYYEEEKRKTVENGVNMTDSADFFQRLTLSLKCMGGISIREYSTDVDMPDYETMSVHNKDGKKDCPVIPGTSWAGAIRSRFEEFAGEHGFAAEKDKIITNELFGYVNSQKKDDVKKSKIIFSETPLFNGVYKETTRNSIDRFSGATKNGALYTERTYYNGETKLEITILKELKVKEKYALASVFADLNNGFLAVGGLTSVGRGLFKITAVNGSEETAKCLDIDSINIDNFIKEVF